MSPWIAVLVPRAAAWRKRHASARGPARARRATPAGKQLLGSQPLSSHKPAYLIEMAARQPPAGLYVEVGAGVHAAGQRGGGKALQLCFLRSPPLRTGKGPSLPLVRACQLPPRALPRRARRARPALTRSCAVRAAGAGALRQKPPLAPRLLVPAPILPAARLRSIGLVAPALRRVDGQPAWLPSAGAQRRKRAREGGATEDADALAAEPACRESVGGWELQMLQMLVLQELTQSERESGVPTLPPALACQLCQMHYGVCLLPVSSALPPASVCSRWHDALGCSAD